MMLYSRPKSPWANQARPSALVRALCEFTFLELRSAQIRDPSQRVAEYWYCSDYCAREDLDVRINRREEQMRQQREANRIGICFFFLL